RASSRASTGPCARPARSVSRGRRRRTRTAPPAPPPTRRARSWSPARRGWLPAGRRSPAIRPCGASYPHPRALSRGGIGKEGDVEDIERTLQQENVGRDNMAGSGEWPDPDTPPSDVAPGTDPIRRELIGVYQDESTSRAAADAAVRAGAEPQSVRIDAAADDREALRSEMREESEHTIAGPGNVGPFTKEMTKGIAVGVPIATVIGA